MFRYLKGCPVRQKHDFIITAVHNAITAVGSKQELLFLNYNYSKGWIE